MPADAPNGGLASPTLTDRNRTAASVAGRYCGFGLVIGLIAYLVLVPLAFLIWRAISSSEGLAFGNVIAAYSVPGTGQMVLNSLLFATGTALLATSIGGFLAFVTVRTNVPFKGILFASSLVPLIIPGVLYTIAWIFLLSDRIGWFNILLSRLGLEALHVDVFSMPGMVIIEGLHLSPIAFLLMSAALRSTDPALEESALTSGARLRSVIRRITLPLVRPALLVSLLVMFIRSLESFETPALVGIPAGRWVFTSQIFHSLNTYPLRYDHAAIYSLTLVLITAVGLLLISRYNRRGTDFQTITGKGFRPRALQLGRWRWAVGGSIVLYFLVVVAAPLTILAYLSLLPFYIEPGTEAWAALSLENYGEVLRLPTLGRSLLNSVLLSMGSATVLMALMAVASWIVIKSRLVGRNLLDSLTAFPLAVPGLVLGISFIFVYLRAPIPVYGTLWILLLAYVTKYMPYAMRYTTTSIIAIGDELEEAAHVSGAGWWATFRRVILPLMAPGLLAGFVFVTVVSIRELSASILLYRQGTEVFSVLIWEMWESGQATELAAIGVMLVLFLTVLVVVASRIGSRIGIREIAA